MPDSNILKCPDVKSKNRCSRLISTNWIWFLQLKKQKLVFLVLEVQQKFGAGSLECNGFKFISGFRMRFEKYSKDFDGLWTKLNSSYTISVFIYFLVLSRLLTTSPDIPHNSYNSILCIKTLIFFRRKLTNANSFKLTVIADPSICLIIYNNQFAMQMNLTLFWIVWNS